MTGFFANLVETKTRPDSCPLHGDFESHQWFGKVWSKCPTCQSERQEAEAKERAEKERADRVRRWESKLQCAAIPERFLDRSLKTFVADTPEQKQQLEFAYAFASQFQGRPTGRSAIFAGPPGTGKTHLAVGIAKHIMHNHHSTALFLTVQRAIRRVRATWSRDSSESETEAVAALVFPDLLILDEVGVQAGSDNERAILFDLLNERYERRRPVLLLTNLEVDECRGYLGDRVFDRLREDGGRVQVFGGESFRGREN